MCILSKDIYSIRHNKELLIDSLQFLDLVAERIEQEIKLSKDSVSDIVCHPTPDVLQNSDNLLKKFFISEQKLLEFSKAIQSELPEKGYDRYKDIIEGGLRDMDGNALFRMPSNYKLNKDDPKILGYVLTPDDFGDGMVCDDTNQTTGEECAAVVRVSVPKSKKEKSKSTKKSKRTKKNAEQPDVELEPLLEPDPIVPEEKDNVKYVARLDMDAKQLYELMKNKIKEKHNIQFPSSVPVGMIQSLLEYRSSY